MQVLVYISFLFFFSFSQQDTARRRWRLVPTCLICTRCVCMLAKPLVIINLWALGCKFFPVDTKLFNKPNMLIKRHRGILKSAVCDPAADASLCVFLCSSSGRFCCSSCTPCFAYGTVLSMPFFYVCVCVCVRVDSS